MKCLCLPIYRLINPHVNIDNLTQIEIIQIVAHLLEIKDERSNHLSQIRQNIEISIDGSIKFWIIKKFELST